MYHKLEKSVLRAIKTASNVDNREMTKLYAGTVNGIKKSSTSLRELRTMKATNITNRKGVKLPS